MSRITPCQPSFGYVDFGNSSTTPLGISGVFTGEWIDTSNWGIAYISTYSDVASADDGLCIQQSTDATNADHSDCFSITASTGKNFAINLHANYLRVMYTNGASAQTEFRLQCIFKENGKSSTHRLIDDITTQEDSQLVTAVLKSQANDLYEFKNVSYVNPMPVNGNVTFPHDLNITNSDFGGFSGNILDIFEDRFTTSIDSSATNPKIITLNFERTIQTTSLGFATATGDFSNILIKWGITGISDQTLYDGSADSTKRTFFTYPTAPLTLSRIIIEFHTADPVSISFFAAAKATQRIAQIQGLSDTNELISIGATTGGNLKVSMQEYGDTPAIDAFDRQRVSEPYTIYDSKQTHDDQPLFYDESLGGSATSSHSTTDARTRLSVTASASDFGIRQTKQYFNYQPGKSQLIFLTYLATQETGVTKRVGYFNGTGTNYMTPYNGIFLQVDDTNISWNVAKNGTTTETATQANWNVDPMDGTGPSGITLDTDGLGIICIDFEWLGVGRIRCGLVISGIVYYCHYFNHANDSTFTSVYMSSPNLPARWDIQSDGTGAGSLDHICGSVMSEGGIEETGVLRSVDTGTTHLDANTADTPYVLLAVRLKTAYLDVTVYPEFMSMISETNDDFRWSLHINPTYNGTLTFGDVANASIQYAAGATANDITAEGIKIDSGFAKSVGTVDRQFRTALKIGSTIAGVRDELILAVTPLSSNADIQGSLTIRELI